MSRESISTNTGRYGTAKDLAKTYATEKVKNWGSGRNYDHPDNGGSSEGHKSPKGIGTLIFIAIIFLFIWGIIVSPGLESGFWETSIGIPLKNTLQESRQMFGYMGSQFANIGRILRGEETFSFESGGAQESVKTGISFQDLNIWKGYVGEPFGIDGKIAMGKIDDQIKEFKDVSLTCELKEAKDKGTIEFRDQEFSNRAVFDLFNPGEIYSETVEDFHCQFNGDEPGIVATYKKNLNSDTIKISLSYPFKVDASLPLYVSPDEIYKNNRGENLFREFGEGEVKSLNPKLLSQTRFISDVEPSISFDNQPLGVNREYLLKFQFKNRDYRNKVDMNSFLIQLPTGMRFLPEQCPDLIISSNDGVLKETTMQNVEKSLSSKESLGATKPFRCKVYVDESIIGDSTGSIIPSFPILAKIDYRYDIISEQSFSLRKNTQT